jgi:hypothetical protein
MYFAISTPVTFWNGRHLIEEYPFKDKTGYDAETLNHVMECVDYTFNRHNRFMLTIAYHSISKYSKYDLSYVFKMINTLIRSNYKGYALNFALERLRMMNAWFVKNNLESLDHKTNLTHYILKDVFDEIVKSYTRLEDHPWYDNSDEDSVDYEGS